MKTAEIKKILKLTKSMGVKSFKCGDFEAEFLPPVQDIKVTENKTPRFDVGDMPPDSVMKYAHVEDIDDDMEKPQPSIQ